MKNYFTILFLFLYLINLNSQSPLCVQYGNVPIDITISNNPTLGYVLASDYANVDFNGKHVLFEGKLHLDSDIYFEGAIIRLLSQAKIEEIYHNKSITFNNCKVYAPCGTGISFIVQTATNNSNAGL